LARGGVEKKNDRQKKGQPRAIFVLIIRGTFIGGLSKVYFIPYKTSYIQQKCDMLNLPLSFNNPIISKLTKNAGLNNVL
jgi:hypothetical protein